MSTLRKRKLEAAAETIADLIAWANLAARQIEVLLAEEQPEAERR